MESATLSLDPVRPDLPLQLSYASCRGRFSTGIEQLPDAPSKQRVGRFCDGIAQAGDADARVRRFATVSIVHPCRRARRGLAVRVHH